MMVVAQRAEEGVTKLTMLGRRDCHLCEEMMAVVEEVGAEIRLELEVRDVDGDEQLRLRYGQEVPVLFVNGRKAFKYRVSGRELRRRIDSERRRRHLPAWDWLTARLR